MSAKPKIAAFPKGWIRDLVEPGKLSIYEWIDMSQAMGIEGLEMYNNFADFKDEANWPKIRKYVEAAESDGQTLIPLAVFFQRGLVKIRLGLCKGRKLHDKRQKLKEQDARKEMREAKARK